MKSLLLTTLILLLSANAFAREEAKIFLPPNYDASKSYPLVVLLHGYAETAGFIDKYFGFSAEVSRGYILVVPSGNIDSNDRRFWNASEGCCDFDHTNPDDVGYILALVKEIQVKYHVDSKQIFAAGHSNGAFMAHRLGCIANSPFSAIVSFAGAISLDPALCNPSHPVDVLQIHAIDDDTIKFEGDPRGYDKLKPYPSTKETLGFWIRYQSCGDARTLPEKIDLTISIPGADTAVTQLQGCRNNSRVELWTIQPHSSI
ncbi:MAG: alpha/beta hydrolase family esterase, partial [Bdellovibrionota bacterium]